MTDQRATAVTPVRARVLVADDDPDARAALSDVLQQAGYEVDLAENGRVALERMTAGRAAPHLLIVDLLMPEQDGWAVLRELRSRRDRVDVPVIVLSALDQAATPMPKVRWLRKPVDANDLLTAVKLALSL
jgi:DNA-binding response OmpR family regulator